MDTKLIDKIIVGRVVPHIYAFSTNTIPNYLKVGDTYRSVDERLNEWRRHFADLTPVFNKEATVNDSVYFRDYALHKYLVDEKGKTRLVPTSPDFPTGIYYSNEFFKNVVPKELDEGIEDIFSDFNNSGRKYDFYNIDKRLPRPSSYAAIDTYKPRPNQQVAIDNFIRACKKGRTNLLMYAVMRFGKSFTSICCAKEMKAKLVVVVTAKADVLEEWKHTVQSHVDFANYGFVFITSKDLNRDNNLITNCLKYKQKPVVFLTLQDLCGKEIKTKHKELFGKDRLIDLLIVDETHFGARADEYGKVLKETEKDINVSDYSNEEVSAEEAQEIYKCLNRKITLHLSGTPYRLLMGSEFSKEDIICFCQFTDIIQEQEKWNKEWLLKDVYDNPKCQEFGKKMYEDVHEWDNPYFGFPKMIRFAFNPNETTQRKLEELKKDGYTFTFSKLLRPKSIKKADNDDHKVFVHEQEILDLFRAIDGSKEDANIFPFLNYDKIQEGKMCRHMVIVLPYCASCDALEELFKKHQQDFLHLKDYEVINISGVDNTKRYKIPEIIKKIEDCEKNDKKTITLTVQRMLTGSTVKEWDTMIYLKDTASPQEYDQAIFRLQNQYVVSALDDKTNETIKIDMKPQTLLVDFAPNRMFYMQEKKAQIYNANVDKSGNSKLGERIKEELRISPIILVNKDRMQIVEETNILEAIANYNMDRGISEEVKEISIDLNILKNPLIKKTIENENEISSRAGLETKAGAGEGHQLETPEGEKKDKTTEEKSGKEDEQKESLLKKIRNYYRKILLFAFLTNDRVISLEDIVIFLSKKDNLRIANNLGLDKTVLKAIIKSHIDKFALSDLDYKIQNMNDLSLSTKISQFDKAFIAISKFGKLGKSVVSTPSITVEKITSLIPDNLLIKLINDGKSILDMSSVAGEFASCLVKRILRIGMSIESIKNQLWSIPQNSICYELTRKIYDLIGLDVNCVSDNYSSSDLLQVFNNNDIDTKKTKAVFRNLCSKRRNKKMIQFDAIVGNPPYQLNDGGDAREDASAPIYQKFFEIAVRLKPRLINMIMPSKWMVGGRTELGPFRKQMMGDKHIKFIVDFENEKDCFSDVNVDGGVNYFLWDSDYYGLVSYTYISETGEKIITTRELTYKNYEYVIRDSRIFKILNKINSKNSFSTIVSKTRPYGIRKYLFNDPSRYPDSGLSNESFDGSVKIYGVKGYKGGAKRTIGYIKKDQVTQNVNHLDLYKIFFTTSYSTGAFNPPEPIIGEPNECCTETFLEIGPFKKKEERDSCLSYIKTNFFKFLLLYGKGTMQVNQKVFAFIPLVPFDKNWSDDELFKLFSLDSDDVDFINKKAKQGEQKNSY